MFIPSTFKRPVSSWKALNLRKTLLMASSVRLKPLNCSRSEERFSRNAETDLVCRLLLEKKKAAPECESRHGVPAAGTRDQMPPHHPSAWRPPPAAPGGRVRLVIG